MNKWRSELVAFLLLYIADVLFRPSDHRLLVDLGGGWGGPFGQFLAPREGLTHFLTWLHRRRRGKKKTKNILSL